MTLFSSHAQSHDSLTHRWSSRDYLVEVFYSKSGHLSMKLSKGGVVVVLNENMIKGFNWGEIKKKPIAEIQRMFDGMYPTVSEYSRQTYEVTFHARGLGGWGRSVHHRYTCKWAKTVGYSEKQAKLIADACHGVDKLWNDKNPVTHCMDSKARGWHFDVKGDGTGGANDSRIIHAIESLHAAIDTAGKPEKLFDYRRYDMCVNAYGGTHKSAPNHHEVREALSLFILGEGLHPLQDIFAHIKSFVQKWVSIHENHLCHMEADKQDYIQDKHSPLSFDSEDAAEGYSQRFTNTKLLTMFYLRAFRDKRKITAQELSNVVKEALEITGYKNDTQRADHHQRFIRLKNRLLPTIMADAEQQAINDALAACMQGKMTAAAACAKLQMADAEQQAINDALAACMQGEMTAATACAKLHS